MTTCTPSCRCVIVSRFGGSRLDCAEMRVHDPSQEPGRESAPPGWKAASSASNSKVRIGPPKPMGKRLADSDSYVGESCASVYEPRTYETGSGRSTLGLCISSVSPESL